MPCSSRVPVRVLAGLAATWLLAQPVSSQSLSAGQADANIMLVLPTRRSPTVASPAAPPALPPGAERVEPLTLETVIERRQGDSPRQVIRQTVTRTTDRIHVAAGNGREWLFERNVLDPRRVSATLVEHTSRALIVYEESDVRNILGINGWLHALTLGFDPDLLASLEPSTQTRTAGGIVFVRYAAAGEGSGMREVWWSGERNFPMRLVTSNDQGSTEFTVEQIRSGADTALVRSPASRFPDYRVFDLAEWLERP